MNKCFDIQICLKNLFTPFSFVCPFRLPFGHVKTCASLHSTTCLLGEHQVHLYASLENICQILPVLWHIRITPAIQETFCLFTQFPARSFEAPQSIMNYVASVKLWHSLLGVDMTAFNSLAFVLTKLGLFRILAHVPKQAAPVTPELLAMFRQHLDISDPTDATFWALFLIAFFTMAPKSNLVPDRASSFDPDKQLSREKVLVGNGCLMVVWTWAKNRQNCNRAHKVPILNIPDSFLSPVEAYKNMCYLVPLEGQHPVSP